MSGSTASFHRTRTLRSAAQTTALARRMAAGLRAGDVLLLEGPIGAGKTHFARALIQARLADVDALEDVPSPTYTLVQVYQAGPLAIWHADLYRLGHPDEVQELGLVEAFESALCLVEWPDRLGDLTPPGALRIRFAPGGGEESRDVTMTSDDPHWAARLAEVADA